ncbi:MAG: hypothetical protein A4E45_02255 [Methanosaeta sp. PtaB.Bin039]|nr:MAG: hypothetical protein A4E45_02255 [Methanosaeta sp. PtaB.Bin039]OPY45449.1 MAG: hypothetical protein A4E47_00965 [Methanosaeta sp. PtaU1.Bin028]HOT06027.1 DUF1699 family protein [Methanotrichaceae archaeon]HQF16323.1 DUF1699 family protein [Methanotrichaceae archaeon]HQI90095.1 DUF1699 family protein [Methanotrichaceae archaeon]
MKIRVVSSKNEIRSLKPDEKMVHLAFRPSNVDLLALLQRCPRLKLIQVPPSYKRTMSSAISVFLDMQGVEVVEGDVWGHRKDLDAYFTVHDQTVEDIRGMVGRGMPPEVMAAEVQKTAKLAPELIKYIARTMASA